MANPSDNGLRPAKDISLLLRSGKCNENPYCLLLGAGASKSSGIETGQDMTHNWKMDLFWGADEEAVQASFEKWRKEGGFSSQESDYSILFSHFYDSPAARKRHIEDSVDEKVPYLGYMYLAGLIFQGRFNRVLTTNFDELLEDALIKYYKWRPIVCSFDSSAETITMESTRPKIFKLHGDFLYDSLRNTDAETRRLGPNMEEKFFRTCEASGLIVVGYGGEDRSIMDPLREMLRRGKHLPFNVHWCVFKPDDDEPRLSETLKKLRADFPDRIRFYAMRSFDDLMCDLFRACECELPPVFVNPSNKSVFSDFRKEVERHGYLSRHEFCMDFYAMLSASRGETGAANVIADADLEHRLGNVLIERAIPNCSKSNGAASPDQVRQARRHFEDSWTTAKRVKSAYTLTDEELLDADKRILGCLVGLLQTGLILNEGEMDTWFAQALDLTKDGSGRARQMTKYPRARTRAFFYNGCCIIGLMVTAGKPISDDCLKDLREYIKSVIELDDGCEDWNALKVTCELEPFWPALRTKETALSLDHLQKCIEEWSVKDAIASSLSDAATYETQSQAADSLRDL